MLVLCCGQTIGPGEPSCKLKGSIAGWRVFILWPANQQVQGKRVVSECVCVCFFFFLSCACVRACVFKSVCVCETSYEVFILAGNNVCVQCHCAMGVLAEWFNAVLQCCAKLLQVHDGSTAHRCLCFVFCLVFVVLFFVTARTFLFEEHTVQLLFMLLFSE